MGEEETRVPVPGPRHPLGLPEPEAKGVRGFVALAFLQENGLELLEKGIGCPLLVQGREMSSE